MYIISTVVIGTAAGFIGHLVSPMSIFPKGLIPSALMTDSSPAEKSPPFQ